METDLTAEGENHGGETQGETALAIEEGESWEAACFWLRSWLLQTTRQE
jgi:hypothetical protein